MQFLIVLLIVFGLAYSIRVPIEGVNGIGSPGFNQGVGGRGFTGGLNQGGVTNRGAFDQGGDGSNRVRQIAYAPGRARSNQFYHGLA